MIFKGSEKLKEGEFDLKIEALGGNSNAATGYDDVHYYVVLPANQINKGLELLSSLIFSPTIFPVSSSKIQSKENTVGAD